MGLEMSGTAIVDNAQRVRGVLRNLRGNSRAAIGGVLVILFTVAASLLAALSVGTYEGWIGTSIVGSWTYTQLGFFAGMFGVVAVLVYIHDASA
jgi:hypothetical protein